MNSKMNMNGSTMGKEDHYIRRAGEIVGGLNDGLIKKQNLSDKEIKAVKKLHLELQDLFDDMRKMSSVTKIRRQVKEIERIEFAMQKAWRFTIDRNFHTWWRRAPHCMCPIMDNNDWIGTNHRIYNMSCVLHGELKPSSYTKSKVDGGGYLFEAKK